MLLRKFGLNAGKFFFGKIHATFGTRMRYLITGGSRFDPVVGSRLPRSSASICCNAYGLTETSVRRFRQSAGPCGHRIGRPAPADSRSEDP